MFSWTYRLNNYISVAAILLILVALTSIIFLPGCEQTAHACENVCAECGKCTDSQCAEDVCADKCAGHQVTPPAHTCESKCPECGKCLDSACTESACTNKCAGHQVTPPAHTCESKCPECGKCLDEACTETACADKCAGHQVTPPPHTCDSKCPECGKCLDETCTEDACANKCAGHAPHVCESICSECGKCLDFACSNSVCANKCEGHGSGSVESGYAYQTYQLNLMSFNIRTLTSNDTGNTHWDKRKDALVSFVINSGADIIGMQEVTKTQFEYIAANLSGNYTALNFPRQGGSNPEGLAFVYDNTKFEFVSSEKYWLSDTPEEQSYGWGESYYRIAVVLVLKHIETGEIVKSINTHGPLLDEANIKAYELIMERSVNEGDPFTFLCGDFNATPGNIGYVSVAEELQDCRVSADYSPARDHVTFTGWGSYVDGETPDHIIDFCFVSKGDNVNVKSYEVRTDRWGDGNYYSDHYAVQTVVEITYLSNTPDQSGNGFDGEIDPA